MDVARLSAALKPLLFFSFLGIALLYRWLLGEAYLPADNLHSFYPFRAQAAGLTLDKPVFPKNQDLIDVVTIYQPQDIYYSEWLKKGVLPLWDDLAFSGHPLQAGNQSAMLYPPKLLISALFSPEQAHNLFLFLHVVVAGMAMYLFLREHGFGSLSAYFGGTCWMLNGATMVRLECKPFLPFSALLPLGLWLILRHSRAPSGRTTASIGCLFGLVLLAGNAQFALYTGLLAAFYYLFLLFGSERRKQLLVWGVAAAALAVLVGGVTVLPTLELSEVAERPPFTVEKHFSGNRFHVENLMTILLPEFLGAPRHGFYLTRFASPVQKPLELTAHVGMVATLLALFALPAWRRRPEVTFFATIAVLSVLIAAGTPLVYLPYYLVPGFKYFTMTRILWLFSFSLAFLAAVGLEECSASLPRRPFWGAVALWSGALLATGLAVYHAQTRSTWAIGMLERMYADGVLHLYLPNYYPYNAFSARITEAILGHFSFTNWSLTLPLWLGLATLVVLRMGRSRGLLLGLAALELLVFAWLWNPTAPFGSTYRETPGIEHLQSAQRVAGVKSGAQPNALTAYGVRIAGGYDSLSPSSYRLFFTVWEGMRSQYDTMLYLRAQSKRFELFTRLAAVDTLYCDPFTDLEGVGDPVYQGEIKIYDFQQALARARVAYRWVAAGDVEGSLIRMADPAFEPSDQVVRLGREGGTERAGHPAEIVEDTPNRKVVRASLVEPGVLILADQFYPGWKATVDGREHPVERVNATFQGVFLEAGDSLVVFTFEPPTFRWGVWLSCLGLAGCLGLALLRPR